MNIQIADYSDYKAMNPKEEYPEGFCKGCGVEVSHDPDELCSSCQADKIEAMYAHPDDSNWELERTYEEPVPTYYMEQ